MNDMESIYTEVITEHSRFPEHKHHLEQANCVAPGRNPSCGDEITLELNVSEGVIREASFTGVGCAVSQASADIMIDLLQGRSVAEARRLAAKFIAMVRREITSEEELEELEEAVALQGIADMPARVKCAVLAWHTLTEALPVS